jgi:cobalamin biosynthesis protein CobT
MAEQGDKNNEISDDAKKLDALADMIRDACSKMDDGVKRMDARMDAIEDSQKRFDARMDAAKKDEDEDEKRDDSDEDEKRDDAREDEDEDEKRDDSDEDEKREDARRKDSRKDSRKDEDEDEKRDDSDEDEKRDDSDEDEDEKVADYAPISKAEAAELRAQIARLQARAPAIITDAERDRFAAVQEQAEPAFQAFGDRAPAPLQGETVTQYKRRLGSKMQVHSTKWKDARLSAVSDEFMLDAVLDDIYADSLAAARRGVDVPVGQLRARERSSGGHTIIEYEGYADSWMNGFAGNSQRGTGNWLRPH